MKGTTMRRALLLATCLAQATPALAQLPPVPPLTGPLNYRTLAGAPVQPSGATVSRPLAAKLGDTVTVLDFGAICDGGSHPLSSLGYTTLLAAQQQGYPAAQALTDEADWAGIQQALDTQHLVRQPPSACVVNKHLTVVGNGTDWRGSHGSSRIVTTSATDDIIQLGVPNTALINFALSDVTFWSTVQKTAGAVVNARAQVGRAAFRGDLFGTIEDVQASGNLLWDGIRMDSAFPNSAAGTFGQVLVDADFAVSHEAMAMANGSEWRWQGRIVGAQTAVHAEGNVGGLTFSGLADISAGGTGVLLDTSVNATPNREFIAGGETQIDTLTQAGITIAANGLSIMKLTGSWIAAAPVGVGIAPGQPAGAQYEMAGLHVDYCSSIGLALGDGLITLSGSILTRNGFAGNGSPFFALYYTSNKGGAITGNVFANNGPTTGSTGQHDAGFIGAGADYFTFTGNVVSGLENDPGALAGRRIIRSNVGVADAP